MVEKKFEIVWNQYARKNIKLIFNYIYQDSPQNAHLVLHKIVNQIEKLESNPERFGLDKFKINNDGSYRYVEVYSYRIAFRIYKNHIRILRIRSSHQEPLLY